MGGAAEEEVDDYDEDDGEWDANELSRWELAIRKLDYTQFTGMHRLQVQTWLLFEEASSSSYAAITQGVILVLIAISTGGLILKSIADCRYVVSAQTMEECVVNATYAPPGGCTRVCEERPSFQVSYFVVEAICIGTFTLEFFLRMWASPATIGLGRFCSAPANMIDLLAIVPFYIELSFLAGGESSGSGANALAVLRIVRLTRVLKVVKKSKTLSGLLVLLRTLIKSLMAVLMIVAFAIIACVVCSSLMHATNETGFYRMLPGSTVYGMHYTDEGDNSPNEAVFANMGEVWWWCLQTLTSLGYGTPWVPVTTLGKVIGVGAALMGTIVLALPIAVIGMHFDDEWSRNRKEQRFEGDSRVTRFNLATQYGTQPVRAGFDLTGGRRGSASNVGSTLVGALNRVHLEPAKDENFSNQEYNVQADISLLLDEHFGQLRKGVDILLETHRDKFSRSIQTDLQTVIGANRSVARSAISAVEALRDAVQEREEEADIHKHLDKMAQGDHGARGMLAKAVLTAPGASHAHSRAATPPSKPDGSTGGSNGSDHGIEMRPADETAAVELVPATRLPAPMGEAPAATSADDGVEAAPVADGE